MEPTNREDLSALMDGELGTEPTRFLLRRLDHDPELAASWSRWHLIRACLASDQAQMPARGDANDFARRVAKAVADDRAPRPRRRNWVQYVGGGALAAGVAVAALMLNAPGHRVDATAPVAQAGPASLPATAVATAPTEPTSGVINAPWLLSRQPTVLSAQPASANVIYGTGLMQPGYLHRAAFARNTLLPFGASPQRADQSRAPLSIVVLRESQSKPQSASSTAAAGH